MTKMGIIKALKGIRYNVAKVGKIEDVVAPPYDVIPPEMQEELYSRHPNNIIRLILGKIDPSDTEDNNRYTRASKDFNAWLDAGVMVEDDSEALYVYRQEFTFKGREMSRTGFIIGYRLDDSGQENVKPHENTLAKPKEDRLKLTRACKANFSPIFGLYDDEEDKIASCYAGAISNPPTLDFKDDKGERHTMWAVTDRSVIDAVVEGMKAHKIMIADGHHRFATAVNYRNEMIAANPNFTGEEPFNYVMMYLTNTSGPNEFALFPTHRLVHNLAKYNKDAFKENLTKYFDVEIFTAGGGDAEMTLRRNLMDKMQKEGKKTNTFGAYIGGREYLKLRLKDLSIVDDIDQSDSSDALKGLDISVLHSIIINHILGVSAENQSNQQNIAYTVKEDEAIKAVDEGKAQLALFLNSTTVEDIEAVVESGEKMPQKSTYFYPKLITGLAINRLV